jgi:hypothetical protein
VTRIVSAVVALVVAAYLVVLIFPWTEGDDTQFGVGEVGGLDVPPAAFSFVTGLGLFLWEGLAVLGVRRTLRSDSLVAFFLAAGTGVMGIATVAHLKWGNPLPWTRDLDTAAFAALPLSILLLAGAVAHLGFYVLTSRAAR